MKKLKLGNLELTLPSPYRVGHVCTAQEAAVLNSVLQGRLQDRLRRQYKGQRDWLDATQAQIEINKQIREASLNGRDAVLIEAEELALQIAKQEIKLSGHHLKDMSKRQLRERAQRILASPTGRTIRQMAITRAEDLAEAVKARLNEQD